MKRMGHVSTMHTFSLVSTIRCVYVCVILVLKNLSQEVMNATLVEHLSMVVNVVDSRISACMKP